MRGNVIGSMIFGFILVFFFFVPLERLFALKREQMIFRKGWLNDLVHFFVNHFLVQAGFVVAAFLVAVLLKAFVSHKLQAAIAAQPQSVQLIEALVISQLAGYWSHRLAHQIPWLWRFHAIHHSIEEMDWLAAARLHPIDQIIDKVVIMIPLFILGFSRATLGGFAVILTLHAIFNHANVRFKFGFLRYIITTPEFHHWHHADEEQAYNKNFSALFPFMDVLFGTYYLPERMPQKYGVTMKVPTGYINQMLYSFRPRQKKEQNLLLN